MTKGRLEAFSDGVIAIIITIIVLEMKVPHGTGLNDLDGGKPFHHCTDSVIRNSSAYGRSRLLLAPRYDHPRARAGFHIEESDR
jgi:Endosomal/lysosomal potassium channel TMEM175